ncbi:DUF4190 domain-containing protein [Microcella flavibacter]|uniref:DUF4190 domain-containing protein n=1 Tax=Microcella flavibacter TaxID=1804990 RepID=UPI001456DD25|nr:DUF4190 domain-containing protein [Microcella flavibacter]
MTDVPPAPQPPEQPATPGGTTPPPAAPSAPAANPYAQQSSAPYGQPVAAPYGGQGYGAPQEKTNVLAIVSLCLGIAAYVIIPFIGSIGAIITGHMALGQIKRTGEKGRGMGLAGLILGYVGIALGLLLVIGFIALIGVAGTASYSTFDDFS